MPPGRLVWHRRALSAAIAIGCTLASIELWPEPLVRGERASLVLMAVGYAHFLGSLSASRSRLVAAFAPRGVPAWLFGAFLASSSATAFAAYAALLRSAGPALHAPIFAALLGLALWHTAENDLALARATRRGEHRVGAVPRDPVHHGLALGVSLLLLALGLASLSATSFVGLRGVDNVLPRAGAGLCGAVLALRRGGGSARPLGVALAAAAALLPRALPGLAFGDFFFAVMLYHFAAWLVFAGERARAEPQARRRLWARVLASHLPPALTLAILLAAGEPLADLRLLLFTPVLYLFWSFAHILQTLLLRGFEPAAAAGGLAG
jgi:hypothetical protein